MSTPSPAYTSPGAVTTGLAGGYCGSSCAARSGPAARTSSARSSSISQFVDRPKPISLAEASRSTASRARARAAMSWNSIGSAAGHVDRGVDAGDIRASSGAQRRRACRAPRARPPAACPACASGDRPAARPRPRTRPAAPRSRGGRTRAATAGPARGRSPARSTGRAACGPTRAGTPKRSRRISSGASTPRSIRRPDGLRQRPAEELVPQARAGQARGSARRCRRTRASAASELREHRGDLSQVARESAGRRV